MKVVVLAETFPRNTGYFGVMFPKYLAAQGADVHLMTLDLPPYWNVSTMRSHYTDLVGRDVLVAGHTERLNGYTVHVLRHRFRFGYVYMSGLREKLRELQPDIVYSLSAIGWIALQAAIYKPRLGYSLFTGSHTAASTFPLYRLDAPWYSPKRIKVFLTRALPGRFVSLFTVKCYGPTIDCQEIAWRFFGVQKRKTAVMHLGVDTDVFHPVRNDADRASREEVRREIGAAPGDLIVIYTGKLTAEKNVPLLLQAVDAARARGVPFHSLVIGEGPDREAIARHPGVKLLPYQSYEQLGRYYRAADVAVWPTNESTSMLDAAACGLPLVVSDGIVYRDHVDGNGLVYRMNSLDDLVDKLGELADPRRRAALGDAGARKMAERFSWQRHARLRFEEYAAELKKRRRPA